MPIPPRSRVYIDTMVWVYHLVDPGHPLDRFCERFLKDIERGNITGISTTFVIHEIVDVSKRLIAKRRGREPAISELQRLQERVEKSMSQLGIEIHDADALAANLAGQSEIFGRAGSIILNSGATLGRDGNWRAVGGADAVHVGLAEKAGASHYATFDEGFRSLNATVSHVIPVMLAEVY